VAATSGPAAPTPTADAPVRRLDTGPDMPSPPTRTVKNMGTKMCNLQTHMDRDHRVEEAKRLEPVYTKLAAEYGIDYEPPTADN